MNKRILHIIDSLGVGGAEKILIGTVNNLEQFENHVVYLNKPDYLAPELNNKCHTINLNYKGPADILRCCSFLKRYILQNNIQIVHSHLPLSTIIARIACPKHVSLFTTIHNLSSCHYFANNRILKILEKTFYKKNHFIIGVSGTVLSDYDKTIGLKGPSAILNNFTEAAFLNSPERRIKEKGKLRLIAVGNLKKAKNYSFLIDAFKNLPAGISLDIYGSGPLKEELLRKISLNNANIKLCGTERHIEKVLPLYDAFIMSSLFEGHPVSIIEAMANGLPLILSDIPVLREAAQNNAFFFSLNDTNELTGLLTNMANDRVDLSVYTEENINKAIKLSDKKNYINSLLQIYNIVTPESALRKAI